MILRKSVIRKNYLIVINEIRQKGITPPSAFCLAGVLVSNGMSLECFDNVYKKKDFADFAIKYSKEELRLCAKAIRKFGLTTVEELFKCEPGKYTEKDLKRYKDKVF